MSLKSSCASVCGFLLSAASSVVLALPESIGAFGSAVEVTGQNALFTQTDSHFVSLAPSSADISFIFGGSLAPSEAHASAAVNSLSVSATSFSNILVTAAAKYWDTLTFSAPAGMTTIPVAVNASFSPNLQVLAGGDFFGYAYALKR